MGARNHGFGSGVYRRMAGKRRAPAKRLRRVGLALALASLGGVAFEEIGRYRDRHRHEQIGTFVDVGGRTLNISCLGSGSPTVVFDTYGHQSGYSWITVQNEAAKYTQACWYDRAGYGWSELGASRRTSQDVASDLRTLLKQAGIPFPIVLVGAGDAASHMRVYYGKYPTEVAGIVLLDANDVDDPNLETPDSEKGGFQRYFGTWTSGPRKTACAMRPLLGRFGLIRFASVFERPRITNSYGLTTTQQGELDDLSDNATTQQATEACAREESMQQARAAGGLGSVPVIVVVSNTGRPRPHEATEEAWEQNRIETVPKALASLSTNGRVVFISGGLTPDAIVRSIIDVLRTDHGRAADHRG